MAALAFRTRFQEQEFIDHAFVGAKADGVAEKTSDGAELASIGAAAAGLDGDNAKGAPTGADFLKQGIKHFWNDVELIEIDGVPGNRRIGLQGGFLLLAEGIDGSVDVLQGAVRRVCDDLGPGCIGFTESHGVGMAWATGATEGFVRHFRHVRSTHHHGHAHSANCIRHAIGLCDHAGHRADADEADFLFLDETGNAIFIHGLRVAVDQQNFMSGGSEGFEQEHPEMRHEIARDTVVWVVQQNSHNSSFWRTDGNVRRQ